MRIHDFEIKVSSGGLFAPKQALTTPVSGWYLDPVTGESIYIEYLGGGASSVYYPTQAYTALWISPIETHAASTVNSGAPIPVVHGDLIRVYYSFKYQGEERRVNLKVGNAGKVPLLNQWDVGDSQVGAKDVITSTGLVTYVGNVGFYYEADIFGKPDLFVQIEDDEGFSVVYTEAFKKVEGEFDSLVITDFAKV